METSELRALNARLVDARTRLLSVHPFFGRLLLRLQFGFADCGTAYTDMKRIVFDPAFEARLSDGELRFVLLHEVMHCVLHHCTRGRSLRPFLYNLACDIVVNSLILETLGETAFQVDGETAGHLVPDGREGRLFSAEEVYEMLLSAPEEQIRERYGESGFDTHIIWEQIAASLSDDDWDQFVKEAVKSAGASSGIPCGLRRYLKDVSHAPKMNWRQVLHDFIRHDRSDYTYRTPDRRYQGDVILPAFRENEYGDAVEKLWFVIDTSASVTSEALTEAFLEIRDALEQIDSLSGELSFFDSEVTKPAAFSDTEELSRIHPVGGGGTSFHAVFRGMETFFEEELPAAIIFLTDGIAAFPEEDAARGVPVLWIIIDSDADAPWGECIHIFS